MNYGFILRIVIMLATIVYVPMSAMNYSAEQLNCSLGTLEKSLKDLRKGLRTLNQGMVVLKKTIEEKNPQGKLKKIAKKWKMRSGRKVDVFNVPTLNIIFCDENGYATAWGIEQLFKSPVEKYIWLKDLIVREVPKSEAPGSFTGKMFKAYLREKRKREADELGVLERPLFFIKITNNSAIDVWKNLGKIQESRIGRFGYEAMSNPEMPIIVSMEMFLTYYDQFGNNRAIEVMHVAKGKSIANLLNGAIDDVTSSGSLLPAKQADLECCGQKLGKALGLFHCYFMNYVKPNDAETWRTVTHNDFHFGNVFFDKVGPRVYFIDNERMAGVFEYQGGKKQANRIDDKGKILIDKLSNPLIDFDQHIKSSFGQLAKFAVVKPDEQKVERLIYSIYAIYTQSFIKGYLSAYPVDKNKRKYMALYLKSLMYEKIKNVKNKVENEQKACIEYWAKKPTVHPSVENEKLWYVTILKFLDSFKIDLDKIFLDAGA